jgi:putative flippase GtrA
MYKQRKDTFLLSVITGIVIVLIVNGGASILDSLGVNDKLSTFIALLIGLIVNFVLQFKIFIIKSKNSYTYMLVTYLITDFIILLTNQILFNYSVDHKKEFTPYLPSILEDNYLLFIRLVVGAFVWCILSYPLRKYLIFV